MSQDRVQVFRLQFAKESSASSPEKAHYLDYWISAHEEKFL